jgi:hypothetical protein
MPRISNKFHYLMDNPDSTGRSDGQTKTLQPIPDKDLERMRRVSDALFGAKHRLPMAFVIADAPSTKLYAEALAIPAGTTSAQAGTELTRFEKAGLLDLLPDEPQPVGKRGRPPKRYKKRRSDVWQLARKLAEAEPEDTARGVGRHH